MEINRELAIKILKYQDRNKDFYFPFIIMCKEYLWKGEDSIEIEPNKWRLIENNSKYQNFELYENLQQIRKETTELMVSGFLEKITNSKNTEDIIRNFIFYTAEGYTSQPNYEEHTVNVENCQVLGWGRGNDAKEAFKNFKEENPWLNASNFNEIAGTELKNDEVYYFGLKN